MPRKKQEFKAEVIRIYNPDPERMRKARELYLNYLARKLAEEEKGAG
ncbi:MAG: hypothetical protein H6Q69_299 [Firmicutes bacterium]|nr:hypothetical protein [Bacillota bacterium]